MFNVFNSMTDKINNIIKQGSSTRMTDLEFLEMEIQRWKGSERRLRMLTGERYYCGDHDIVSRKREILDEDGHRQELKHLPNNRNIDNQYAKMVNQKANYLLGKPVVVKSQNEQYATVLKHILNKRFMKTLKNTGKAAINHGLSWLYVHYDNAGEICFRLFPGYEILPFWKDSEHTVLDFAVRLYLVEGYEGIYPKIIEKVEVYDLNGVHKYILDGNKLIEDVEDGNAHQCHVNTEEGGGFNWSKIPLIPFKYNENEIPLIKKIKTLQDGINIMLSDFENNMQQDARTTVLVINNYDGADLEEFRFNLATYGVVKVQNDGDSKGGVEKLEIEVNADNYKVILEIFKKALIENAMGYDAKDDRLAGSPNQMNIQSMYSDIDLESQDIETEFQAAFEDLLWFIDCYLTNSGQGDFEKEEVDIVFNRNIIINESELIDNCIKSLDVLSEETVISKHPWIADVEAELERIESQRQKEQDNAENALYGNAFGQQDPKQVNIDGKEK